MGMHLMQVSVLTSTLFLLLLAEAAKKQTSTSTDDPEFSRDDPRHRYPMPPFPDAREQDYPGLESSMKPKPDFGLHSYKGSGRLAGKTALITGGDSGIGRAVAFAFASEGADVAITYLPVEEDDASEIQAAIEKLGRKCHKIQTDFRKGASALKEVANKTLELFGGKIDILVNNAAYQPKLQPSFENYDYDTVMTTFQINIVSIFELTRLLLPHIPPGGSVICTSSTVANNPNPAILHYTATKAAISNFVKGLSKAAIKRGVRVNAVGPGPVWTPFIPQSFGGDSLQNFGREYCVGRPGQPAEMVGMYVLLASNEGSDMVGKTYFVDGGERCN